MLAIDKPQYLIGPNKDRVQNTFKTVGTTKGAVEDSIIGEEP